MTDDHGRCQKCNTDLNGSSIWQTGYEFALAGKHYEQHGKPAESEVEAERMADEYAEAYGASRTNGRWGREIGIYDWEQDRTVRWQCPDCEHEWPR